MGLRGRPERTVALNISLGNCDRQIVVAAIPIVLLDPLPVLRFAGSRQPFANNTECEQCVCADFLDQHHQGRTFARRSRDQFAPLAQVITGLRQMEVTAILGGAVFYYRQGAVVWVVGHTIIDASVFDCESAYRMSGNVVDSPPAKIDRRP